MKKGLFLLPEILTLLLGWIIRQRRSTLKEKVLFLIMVGEDLNIFMPKGSRESQVLLLYLVVCNIN